MDQDEFSGQGGSFVVGKDGKRQLVERTQEQQPQGAAPEPAAQADDKPASMSKPKR